MTDIYNYLSPDRFADECTQDTYLPWKKALNKLLKTWDKWYVKHTSKKGCYEEINNIHTLTMKPLIDLIHANSNLEKMENLLKKNRKMHSF